MVNQKVDVDFYTNSRPVNINSFTDLNRIFRIDRIVPLVTDGRKGWSKLTSYHAALLSQSKHQGVGRIIAIAFLDNGTTCDIVNSTSLPRS